MQKNRPLVSGREQEALLANPQRRARATVGKEALGKGPTGDRYATDGDP